MIAVTVLESLDTYEYGLRVGKLHTFEYGLRVECARTFEYGLRTSGSILQSTLLDSLVIE